MSSDSNDAEVLMQSFADCCPCHSHGTESSCGGKPVPVVLSSIKGPWALIYWQVSSSSGKFLLNFQELGAAFG